MYIVGSFGYSYRFIVNELLPGLSGVYDWWDSVFITTRNGVFNGFPWFILGCMVAKYGNRPRRYLYTIGCLVAIVLVVAESFVIKRFDVNAGVDTGFALIPFITFLLLLVTNENVYLRSGKVMRSMSTLIFLTQRIFLTAIPSLIPAFAVMLSTNSYVGAAVVLIGTCAVSILILIGSKKYSVLKRLV